MQKKKKIFPAGQLQNPQKAFLSCVFILASWCPCVFWKIFHKPSSIFGPLEKLFQWSPKWARAQMTSISCSHQVQGVRNAPSSPQSVHAQQSPTHVAVPRSPSSGLYWFEPDSTREGGAVGPRRWLDKSPPKKILFSADTAAVLLWHKSFWYFFLK